MTRRIMTRQTFALVSASLGILLVLGLFAKSALVKSKNTPNPKQNEGFYSMKNTESRLFKKQWHEFDSLQSDGLTQSAIEKAEEIYELAKKAKENPEMIRALLASLSMASQKEEDAYVKAIARLEKEVKETEEPVQSVLNVLLAEHYWSFFQSNRWRFYNRTETNAVNTSDIQTWDLNTLFQKIQSVYKEALKNPEPLQKLKLASLSSIITNGNDSINRRPTLYDLVAHRALNFFMNEEPEITKPVYQFVIDSISYFLPVAKFSKLKIDTKDSSSLRFQSLTLMQKLITFHMHDEEPTALIDIDLIRLQYVYQHSTLINKQAFYLEALNDLRSQHRKKSASSEVNFVIASVQAAMATKFTSENLESYREFYKKAIETCQEGINSFPNSYGSEKCKCLINDIQTKNLSLHVEPALLPEESTTSLITYKNIDKMYLRLVNSSPDEFSEWNGSNSNSKQIFHLASQKTPAHSWTVSLPDSGDYQTRSIEITLPPLKLGFWILLASYNEDFLSNKSLGVFAPIWSTKISYINRKAISDKGGDSFLFLDRKLGTPIANAQVNFWTNKYNESKRKYTLVLYAKSKSDAKGELDLAPIKSNQYQALRLEIVKDDDRYFGSDEYYPYPNNPSKASQHQITYFFSDRAIYRPGQTVYFKGIMLTTDGEKSDILKNQSTTVRFIDVNGKEVAQQTFRSNKYGSFNGSFTAPTGVLSGRMALESSSGRTEFSVEEYKRPKFYVNIDPVEGNYRLGETISIKGKAMAYAGSAIDGAEYKYHVVREARFPWWWCWWRPRPSSPAMEISSGTGHTNDTGAFAVSFTAIPDQEIPKSENPQFIYTITVDVIDINGETRSSSSSIPVAYQSLSLDFAIPEKVNRDSLPVISIQSSNLSGKFQAVKGSLNIYLLESPKQTIRSNIWKSVSNQNQPLYRVINNSKENKNELVDDPMDFSKWKRNKSVYKGSFNTAESKELHLESVKNGLENWPLGSYVLEAETQDSFGQPVKQTKYFTLYSANSSELPIPMADWFVAQRTVGEPGSQASFLIGSNYSKVKVLYEIEFKSKIVHKDWIELNKNQKQVSIPIEEKHRGNFSVHFLFVRENRVYSHTETVQVPWTNKELKLEFSSFRDKLQPGQPEEWQIKISGPKQDKVAAEMVATLYDASLDAFLPHNWNFSIYPRRGSYRDWQAMSELNQVRSGNTFDSFNQSCYSPTKTYSDFYWQNYNSNYYAYNRYGRGALAKSRMARSDAPAMELSAAAQTANLSEAVYAMDDASMAMERQQVGGGGSLDDLVTKEKVQENSPDLSQVKARSNFNETAFFFPDLHTNEKGDVILKFTIPEALTQWKMLGFAHTQDLKFGQISNQTVTQKELMVMPNAPRFFRENDQIRFSSKVVNLSDKDVSGTAELMLTDSRTGKSLGDQFQLKKSQQSFSIKQGLSTALFWNLHIPSGIEAVTYKVVAKAGSFTDGEEDMLPVLSNTMMVTESMPLPIRKAGSKHFEFTKLLNQNQGSKTLRNYKVTLEYSPNPAWYAIQALPYLMDYPYECAEQTFSRFYANSIASHVANSNPKIKSVFEQWKQLSSESFLSKLESNQELKSLLLQETPWVVEAQNEQESKRRLGLLFDLNRMSNEKEKALRKLQKLQLSNGGWPWFAGGPDDPYITQYIVTGLGRLDHIKILSLRNDSQLWPMTQTALNYMDERIREDYENILKFSDPKLDHLGYTQIQYLYTRSFFKDVSISSSNQAAFNYYLGQAKQYWLNKDRYMQGMLALALNRNNVSDIAKKIMASLKQNALVSDEMGMYWKENYEDGWNWWRAPIESQALMVEAFDEVTHDSDAVEDLKAWLLKSKQTQNWQSTKATTEAIYALILRGTDGLSKESDVHIQLGTISIDTENSPGIKKEAGTGYFKKFWNGSEISPDMGKITITKKSDGVAWGALYWQYFEQMDKITFHETPLKLSKKFFLQKYSDTGVKLFALSNEQNLKPGDKVTVRIELRSDRDMQYMHLKDMRGSGFEPLNVLSGYRYQNGLGYYEATKDASTDFFIDNLPKGTYVFEYPIVVSHSGEFSTGISSIQCMYAPEFTSHSEGFRIKVE